MKQIHSMLVTGIKRGGRAILTMEDWPGKVLMRWQLAAANPEAGMATAEYAVVLIAATGFAGLLAVILRSDSMKEILTNLVQKALNV